MFGIGNFGSGAFGGAGALPEIIEPPAPAIDALSVPFRQTVVFEGSRRVVEFEGSRRIVEFE